MKYDDIPQFMHSHDKAVQDALWNRLYHHDMPRKRNGLIDLMTTVVNTGYSPRLSDMVYNYEGTWVNDLARGLDEVTIAMDDDDLKSKLAAVIATCHLWIHDLETNASPQAYPLITTEE